MFLMPYPKLAHYVVKSMTAVHPQVSQGLISLMR